MRVFTAVLLTIATAPSGHAQGPATPAATSVRIIVLGDQAAIATSGVLPLRRQGRGAALSVQAIDAQGAAVQLRGAVPVWSTSDAGVASLINTNGTRPQVVAQGDGRAVIAVSLLGRTDELAVAVGSARAAVTAAELAPSHGVVRLEVSERNMVAGQQRLLGSALLLEPNVGARLRARAYIADGTELELNDEGFPVVWLTSDPGIVEMRESSAADAWFIGRGQGRVTVSAAVQGVMVTLHGFTGVPQSELDPGILAQAATSTDAAPASSGSSGSIDVPGVGAFSCVDGIMPQPFTKPKRVLYTKDCTGTFVVGQRFTLAAACSDLRLSYQATLIGGGGSIITLEPAVGEFRAQPPQVALMASQHEEVAWWIEGVVTSAGTGKIAVRSLALCSDA